MGAFVFDPVPGFYRYPTITLDFNSLYPSVMITYNISPETLLDDLTIKDNGVRAKDINTVNVLKKIFALHLRACKSMDQCLLSSLF